MDPIATTKDLKSTIAFEPALANRHGLIAGSTGTGKTITLQRLAENFSSIGVPVFMADVKGDLSGLASVGGQSPRILARVTQLGLTNYAPTKYPVMFWDLFGEQGHPVRTTISEFGPTLLARLMGLNDTQSSILQIVFKIADDSGLLILDIKDLTALLGLVQNNLDKFKATYGHLSPASIGIIQRGILTLETQGLKNFFGEPAFSIMDLLQNDVDGKGFINILAADKLLQKPMAYATFLLWMLSELFETLPEAGDLDKPKLVFFFDEAHLLFRDAPKPLLETIEQVVRLIRSKGVGVYFVTQSPSDVPNTVLGQLSHRVQHALRAFTPADQKAVQVAAQTMRQNPAFDAAKVLTELEIGEALISVLDKSGTPTIVERGLVHPPTSQVGPVDAAVRKAIISSSPIAGHYEKLVDRESAFEVLQAAKQQTQALEKDTVPAPASVGTPSSSQPQKPSVLNEILFGSTGPRGGRREGIIEKAATSAARQVATSVGREIMRGIMGSLLGGGRRR